MEVFGIIGMSIGSMGFIFGIMGLVALTQVTELRKDHDALKESLRKSGYLSDPGS